MLQPPDLNVYLCRASSFMEPHPHSYSEWSYPVYQGVPRYCGWGTLAVLGHTRLLGSVMPPYRWFSRHSSESVPGVLVCTQVFWRKLTIDTRQYPDVYARQTDGVLVPGRVPIHAVYPWVDQVRTVPWQPLKSIFITNREIMAAVVKYFCTRKQHLIRRLVASVGRRGQRHHTFTTRLMPWLPTRV